MRYTPSSIIRLEGAAMAGTQMNLRIDAKRRALERGLYLRDRLEAALGPLPPCDQRDLPDRELRGEALISRWEQRGLA